MANHILITGGCGYIGSHVALLLQQQGHLLVAVDNLSTGHDSNMVDGVHYEAGDIANSQLIGKLIDNYHIDTVMHLAAKTSVEESTAEPALYYEENTFKSIQLMQTCGQHAIRRFIFSSTAAIYGQSNNKPLTEQSYINPTNVYGKSKYLAELALSELAHRYEIDFTALRYFNVAGHDHALRVGNHNAYSSALIAKICRNISNDNLSINVNGNDFDTKDGSSVRDYVHVMDIANAHALLTSLSSKAPSIVNVGYGKGMSVLDVIEQIENISKKKLNITITEQRAGDIAYSVADNTVIKSLGWKSLYDDPYQEIFASELAWCNQLARVCN